MESLSRAKQSLLVVQSNLELEILDYHSQNDQHLSSSVFTLCQNSATTTHILHQWEEATINSAAVVSQNHEMTERTLVEIFTSHALLEQVSAEVSDTVVTAVQRLERMVNGIYSV